ncbi:hypothetical protein IAT38_001729 [Cryptococcus sp. DSM 104549]
MSDLLAVHSHSPPSSLLEPAPSLPTTPSPHTLPDSASATTAVPPHVHAHSHPSAPALAKTHTPIYPTASPTTASHAMNPGYEGQAGYAGYEGTGGQISRFVTPGGHPQDNSQLAFPIFHRRFGNPTPLGLLAFSTSYFLMSLYKVHTHGVVVENAILSMALGYGGLAVLIAGFEEWACGNTFGATLFLSLSGFWLSYAILWIPQFEVQAAYPTSIMLSNAIGLFFVMWACMVFVFIFGSLKSSVALVMFLVSLEVSMWCIAGGYLGQSVKAMKAGGGIGIFTSAIGGYISFAALLTKDTAFFLLPVGDLSHL